MKKSVFLAFCIANITFADSHGLIEILNSARENDSSYESQHYKLAAKKTASAIKVRSLYPTAQYSVSGQNRPSTNSLTGNLSLSMPIIHSPLYTEQHIGHLEMEMTDLSLLEFEQNYRINVTLAYFNLLSKYALLNSQGAELNLVENNYKKTLSMAQSDMVSEVDALSAKANYDKSRVGVLEAETNLRHAKGSLNKIVNQDIDRLRGLSRELVSSLTVPDRDTVFELAKKHNIQFLRQQKSLEKAYSELKKVNGKYYPTLSISMAIGQDLKKDIFDTDNMTRQATLSASFNLYNGGRDTLAVEASTLTTFAAENDLDNLLYDLGVNSNKVVSDFNNAKLKREAAALAEMSALKKLDAMYEKRQVGQASELELSSAITQATRAQNDHINASHLVVSRYLEVAKLSGQMTDEPILAINEILGEDIAFDLSASPSTANDYATKMLSLED
ncbi:TolC family protein [Gammaproteobacteria bacterium]|nr:TolC family protein [Gammaproteobacteria bacterium]